jgi:predicted outer membrane protein
LTKRRYLYVFLLPVIATGVGAIVAGVAESEVAIRPTDIAIEIAKVAINTAVQEESKKFAKAILD